MKWACRFALLLFCVLNIVKAFAATDAEKQGYTLIALAPHIVESLYAIGAGEQIVATSAFADYPEAAKSIPTVANANNLQIERIIELAPDIIIAWKTGNPADQLQRLERLGFTVVYSNPQKLMDVAAELRLFGQLTGRQERAEEVAQQYSGQLNALRRQYSDKSPLDVFYELWPLPLRTVAKQAWVQQQLTVCGVNNVFKHSPQDYPLVNFEQVLAYSPQAIIQPVQGNGRLYKDSIQWQNWSHIPAVKNKLILHPNADKMHRMTTRMLDELSLLCEQLEAARQAYR